jgi:hypothetical protein
MRGLLGIYRGGNMLSGGFGLGLSLRLVFLLGNSITSIQKRIGSRRLLCLFGA